MRAKKAKKPKKQELEAFENPDEYHQMLLDLSGGDILSAVWLKRHEYKKFRDRSRSRMRTFDKQHHHRRAR